MAGGQQENRPITLQVMTTVMTVIALQHGSRRGSEDVSYSFADLQDCTDSYHVCTDKSLSTILVLRPGPEYSHNGQDW